METFFPWFDKVSWRYQEWVFNLIILPSKSWIVTIGCSVLIGFVTLAPVFLSRFYYPNPSNIYFELLGFDCAFRLHGIIHGSIFSTTKLNDVFLDMSGNAFIIRYHVRDLWLSPALFRVLDPGGCKRGRYLDPHRIFYLGCEIHGDQRNQQVNLCL